MKNSTGKFVLITEVEKGVIRSTWKLKLCENSEPKTNSENSLKNDKKKFLRSDSWRKFTRNLIANVGPGDASISQEIVRKFDKTKFEKIEDVRKKFQPSEILGPIEKGNCDMERSISSPNRLKLATGLQVKNISHVRKKIDSFNKLSSSSILVSKHEKYQGSLIETAFQLANCNTNPQDLNLINKPEYSCSRLVDRDEMK